MSEPAHGATVLSGHSGSLSVSFSLRRDLFIPWERLESMRFLTLRQVIAEGLALVAGKRLVRPGCIAPKLKDGPALVAARNSPARPDYAGRPTRRD